MSTRRFRHSYSPGGQGTSNLAVLELTTTEIADAAISEIIQMALSSSPFDILVEQLLNPGDHWFRWVGQLGQIRETKTALSGLFGRFVARAYLTRFCGYTHYEPISSNLTALRGWPALSVIRSKPGDLPDWIVANGGGAPSSIAIAEAKGSHNAAGSGAALKAAIEQATRVDVTSGGTKIKIKRYAIASRWAVTGNASLTEPWLSVDDPSLGDRDPTEDEALSLRRSVVLGHYSALLHGFGLESTVNEIQKAKRERPGTLQIAPSDLVEVETASGVRAVFAVIVTRSGIVRLPTRVNSAYQAAIQMVYEGDAFILALDPKVLISADRNDQLAPAPSFRDSESSPLSAHQFWRSSRTRSDGSEYLSLDDVRIRSRLS